jgi:arginine decarboxylase-like protein
MTLPLILSDNNMKLVYSAQAESAANILGQVGFDAGELMVRYKQKLSKHTESVHLQRNLLALIQDGLESSSYLRTNDDKKIILIQEITTAMFA